MIEIRVLHSSNFVLLVNYSNTVRSSPWCIYFHFFSFMQFLFFSLEKAVAPYSSTLAWKIPGMGEPGGLPSMGSNRVRHDWSDLAAVAAANCGGGNEDNGDFLQKVPCMYCYTQCPQPWSRPPVTHTFARDSQTPTGKSPVGSLSLSPGSWCTRTCCALQKSISQSYVSSGSSMVGLMATWCSRCSRCSSWF